MTIKYAAEIGVGIYDSRVGFTVTYTDGERAHFLFSKDVAQQLDDGLRRAILDLTYLETQLNSVPGDRVGIHDAATVRLTPPPSQTGGALGIGGEDGMDVSD